MSEFVSDVYPLLSRFDIQVTCAMRILATGCSADETDEYCRLSETVATKSYKRFCQAIIAVYESKYLRVPTEEDMKKQMKLNAKRGRFHNIGFCFVWTYMFT